MTAYPNRRPRGLRNAILIGAGLLGLSGCVYGPAPYAAGPDYYAAPGYSAYPYSGYGYYAPSVGVTVGDSWRGGDGRWR